MKSKRRTTRRHVLATSGVLLGSSLAGCSESTSDDTGVSDETETPVSEEETTTDTQTDTAEPDSTVETVVEIPGDRVPENMAIGPNGALYFGITAGEVRRVSADQRGGTGLSVSDTERIATLPGTIGVETGPEGTVYAAVSGETDQTGVWAVPPDGDPSLLVRIDGFPNDILFDTEHERLLVTESQDGVVYSVDTDGTRETWLDDDRLSTESFGANGITRDENGQIHIAVTRAAGEVGRILSVSVTDDGNPRESSVLIEGAEVFGADGITAQGGSIFVAANSQNRIVRVDPGGETTIIADGEDGLVFPSDVVFDPEITGRLFICNFANDSPEDGAILRTQL